jgi:hypothetical protein
MAQAARDFDVHSTVLRRRVKQYGADPANAFPGRGQMTPADDEVRRLRREVAKLKAERDIPNWTPFAHSSATSPVRSSTSSRAATSRSIRHASPLDKQKGVRGSQFASEPFQRLMADNGITCSMSRSGNAWDNAAMESFFSSLKTERIRGTVYRARDQARADVFDYIERFYNPRRRHSTLDYMSPSAYEKRAMRA